MVIDNKYDIGQKVYLVTDTDQSLRIITAITVRQGGIIYELCLAEKSSSHYEFEISAEEDVSIKVK